MYNRLLSVGLMYNLFLSLGLVYNLSMSLGLVSTLFFLSLGELVYSSAEPWGTCVQSFAEPTTCVQSFTERRTCV